MRKNNFILSMIAGLLFITPVFSADWAGFRGTLRDGRSNETGLLKEWPAGGPQMIWSTDILGIGWSSAAIGNGRVYITGMEKDSKNGVVYAFDIYGKPLWQQVYGPEWTGSFPGVRTTPTLSENKLYVMSGNGLLCCLDAITGEPVWNADTNQQFKWQKGGLGGIGKRSGRR